MDTFIFTLASNNDTIVDFSTSSDTLQFPPVELSAHNYSYYHNTSSDGIVISAGSSNVLLLGVFDFGSVKVKFVDPTAKGRWVLLLCDRTLIRLFCIMAYWFYYHVAQHTFEVASFICTAVPFVVF